MDSDKNTIVPENVLFSLEILVELEVKLIVSQAFVIH